MEASGPARALPSGDPGDLSSQDVQTVCEALGRYEETLRGAVREIQVDIQGFKSGVDRQVAEVLRLATPLSHNGGRAPAGQPAAARPGGAPGPAGGEPRAGHPAPARPTGTWSHGATHAMWPPQRRGSSLPLGGKGARRMSQVRSGGRGLPPSVGLPGTSRPLARRGVWPLRVPLPLRRWAQKVARRGGAVAPTRSSTSGGDQVLRLPGSFLSSGSPREEQEPPPLPSTLLEAHAPAMSVRMAHLPVTAVTRGSDTFSGEKVGSPVSATPPGGGATQ